MKKQGVRILAVLTALMLILSVLMPVFAEESGSAAEGNGTGTVDTAPPSNDPVYEDADEPDEPDPSSSPSVDEEDEEDEEPSGGPSSSVTDGGNGSGEEDLQDGGPVVSDEGGGAALNEDEDPDGQQNVPGSGNEKDPLTDEEAAKVLDEFGNEIVTENDGDDDLKDDDSIAGDQKEEADGNGVIDENGDGKDDSDLIAPDSPAAPSAAPLMMMANRSVTEYYDAVTVVEDYGVTCGYFRLRHSTMTNNGNGTVTVVLHDTYQMVTAMYLGYATDKDKYVDVQCGYGADERFYEFNIPASYMGTYQPVTFRLMGEAWDTVTYYIGYNVGSDAVIPFPSGTDVPVGPDEPVGPVVPVGSDKDVRIVNVNGVDSDQIKVYSCGYTIFDDNVRFDFQTEQNSYNALFFGTINEEKNELTIGEPGSHGYAFSFIIPVSQTGQNIPVCFGNSESGLWYVDIQLYIKTVRIEPSEPEGPVTYENKVVIVNEKTEDDGLFPIEDTKIIFDDGEYTVSFKERRGIYSGIYFGPAFDENKTILASPVDGVYTFGITADDIGKYQPITFYDPNKEDWGETTYYLGIKNLEDDTIAELVPAVKPEEPPVTYTDKVVCVKADTTAYGMFKPTNSVITVQNGKYTVSFTDGKGSYEGIYFGPAFDKDKTIQAEPTNGVYSFEITEDTIGRYNPVTFYNDDHWIETTYYLGIKNLEDDTIAELVPVVKPEEPDPHEPVNIPEGYYNVDVDTSASMFKVAACEIVNENGQAYAIITLNKYGYDKLYAGTAEAAASDPDGVINYYVVQRALGEETEPRDYYTFNVPLPLDFDGVLHVASHSSSQDKWYDRTITFDLESMKKTAADGSYTVDVESSSPMFKITDAKLSVVNGEMVAKITLSGTGYDLLYAGTGEQAAQDEANAIAYSESADGKYEFIIPVSELDKPISIAAHSVKNGTWYDRQITFKSDTLAPGDWDGPDGDEEEPTVPDTNPDSESQHEADSSGSTSGVDSSTTLPDGVYTPDKFSFSGGTGKVNITCPKITVIDGQAYATIVFDSGSYNYVKANGNIYYGDQTATTSTFVIPVELNTNNRILGNTTKMSQAHEIEYYIFPYLAAAEGTQSANEDAPVIEGIKYESEEKLEYAEYFRVYNYESGIILIEIDLIKDTVFEGRTASGEDGEPTETGEEGETIVKTAEELTAELYQKDTVKYLIVPEGVKIPAGLEKEMVVITLPKKSISVSSEGDYAIAKALGCEKLIKGIGIKESSIEDKDLKDAVKAGDIIFTGAAPELSLRDIVSSEIDLYIAPGTLLPLKEEGKKEDEKDTEKVQKELYEMTDSLSMLGIPVIFDCSEREKTDLAKYEWIKLFGTILGKKEEAQKLFDEYVKASSQTEVK